MTAIFIGDGSLLVECAEEYLRRNGRILAVLSTDQRVLDWAGQKQIDVRGTPAAPDIGDLKADYVFSVANLVVLPDSVLAAASKLAINFHDGPLPHYSGLNVTSWALMAGERRHAVTWHEMTKNVDAGRILASAEFDIAPDETAFSLNAKCYEQALAAFSQLMDTLGDAIPAGRTQFGERRWFGRDKRPEMLATLNFGKTAAELSSLVRALDFGNYANTLTAAKIWTGLGLVAVGKLEPAGPASAAAGTVLELENDALTVAASDGAVRLSQLYSLDGGSAIPLLAGVVRGNALEILSDETRARIARIVPTTAAAENRWLAQIANGRAAPLPHALARPVGSDRVVAAEMGTLPDGAETAFAVWLALLSGEFSFSLSLPGHADWPKPWVKGEVSVSIALEPNMTVSQAIADVAHRHQEAVAQGPVSGDLVIRLPVGPARLHAADVLSVAVSQGADIADSALLDGRRLVLARLDGNWRLIGRGDLFDSTSLGEMARQFADFAREFASSPSAQLRNLQLGGQGDLVGTMIQVGQGSIQHQFASRVAAMPDATALVCDGATFSFRELDNRAAVLAGALVGRGAGPGAVIGLCLPRSAEMVIGLLAILRTGAAYLPLDPDYPVERIRMMVADSQTSVVLADPAQAEQLGLDASQVVGPGETAEPIGPADSGPDGLAYLIYTSGSTGKPKGVMVRQANVLNFFAGMDSAVPHDVQSRLLAVTSISFDISVLELFWTLTRGMTVVLQTDGAPKGKVPGFSLFYFASEAAGTGHHAYRLLLEGSRFADENGFEAIWTPERHFHAFGGLYPNPAISSAAVAGMTRNVKIRAGSIVLPLHHPVRAAEDWALVDNISGGRAGIAVASGWQPNDFILAPYNFESRKDIMLDSIDMLRALWRGERVAFKNHKGEMVETATLPRPVQDEIPIWITAAGNPETFAAAARKGCGVLTHLLGQTFDEVADKIRAYRVAWAEAGHKGSGTVTLMLHTFVGDDEDMVRETARGPMKSYLKSAVDLVKRASWSFPTFVQKADASGMTPQQVFEKEDLSPSETDALLDHAFNRYYRESGLFGTPESCEEIVRRVAAIGVDEIACLIDFGIDTDLALKHLQHIKVLMDRVRGAGDVGRKASTAEYIVENAVTHLQCTPSAAAMLLADTSGRSALGHLQVMLVGGEALPTDVASSLRAILPGTLLNMYGPTETTVWSSVATLETIGESVPLGAPIANTTLSVRNELGQQLPEGLPGELWIGGAGVTGSYWQRPELTAEKFVGGFYRTGDLVRRRGEVIEFLGRIDNQVKIRGHRIELGEIESRMAAITGVAAAVVVAQDAGLVGYCTAQSTSAPDPSGIRMALATQLPDYMVPSQIVVLDRMPLTPNGKIDRKALKPAPAARNEPADSGSDAEVTIARIWCQALGLQQVGLHDNFFDLGGHSLLVVQVQRMLKQKFDREIPIVDMFRFPTVASLAELVSGEVVEDDAAARRGQDRAATRRSRMSRR